MMAAGQKEEVGGKRRWERGLGRREEKWVFYGRTRWSLNIRLGWKGEMD